MAEKRRGPMWTCPKCGHRFVTRHLWHSCVRVPLATHFARTDPVVRRIFNRFRDLVRACGPATIYAQKTRITVQGRVRFASVVTRKRWVDIGLWLTRERPHDALRTIERIVPDCYVHTFRLTAPDEMDDAFVGLLREAYAVGQQEHLDKAGDG